MLLCNFGSTGEARCCLKSILYCRGSETALTLALHIQKLKVSLHEASRVATSASAWELLCQVRKTGRWKPGACEVHKNPAVDFKEDRDSAGSQSQTLFHPQQFKWNFLPLSTTKSVCSWKTWRTWKTSHLQLIHIIKFRLPQMSKYMLFISLKVPAEYYQLRCLSSYSWTCQARKVLLKRDESFKRGI